MSDTDFRLRFMVRGQTDQEMFSVAVLRLEPGFEEVRNTRPFGGADGGVDMLFRYQGFDGVGGVAFKNQCTDSDPQRNSAVGKIKRDIKSAKKSNPMAEVFLCFTNLTFKNGQISKLEDAARGEGFTRFILYDRPRIEQVLDGLSGQIVKQRYLSTPSDPPWVTEDKIVSFKWVEDRKADGYLEPGEYAFMNQSRLAERTEGTAPSHEVVTKVDAGRRTITRFVLRDRETPTLTRRIAL